MDHADEPHTPTAVWSPPVLGSPGSNRGDQIALDALLSLGNEHATVFIDRNVRPDSVSSGTFHESQSPIVYRDALAGSDSFVQEIPFSSTVTHNSDLAIPEESEFRLLKHYRYEVAPWVRVSPPLRLSRTSIF